MVSYYHNEDISPYRCLDVSFPCVGQVLVDGDTAGLECLRGDLLLFVTDQVGYEGEEIDGCLLGTDIVNLDLRFGHTTAVA